MRRALAIAMLVLALIALGLSAMLGCGTKQLAGARFGASEAVIRSARDHGAGRVPDAAVHLELAQRQLAQARRYVDDGDLEEAQWMLIRADSDARLALALAREARAREAADEVATRVRDLSSTTHASPGGPL
jgi:hypothetical protein